MADNSVNRLRWAVFLVSAGITAYQIALMQILSYLQWYHFAYLVVSLALLGFGTSGTILALWRTFFIVHKVVLIPWLLIACGLAMPWALNLSQTVGIRCDVYLLFVDKTQIWRLASSSLLYLTPFLLGALVIGLALITEKKDVGKLYCANLIGSGAGGLAGLILTALFLPEDLPAIIGLGPVSGGLILVSSGKWREPALMAALAVGSVFLLIVFPGRFAPSQFKDISRALNAPDASIIRQMPSPRGLVQVVASSSLRHAPGLSLNFRGSLPVPDIVFVDGNASGALPSADGKLFDPPSLFDYTTEILGYAMAEKGGRALLLQPAGEEPIAQAITHKMREIVVVEPHSEIYKFYEAMAGREMGKAPHPFQLIIENADPRQFLSQQHEEFEIIRFPTIGSFGGSVGLQALSAQFLLTKESFRLAWERLSHNGIILITCWMDYPVKTSLKIAATLAEVLDELEINEPKNHLAAIRSWGSITFAMTKSPLSREQTMAIREECAKLFFDPLLLPHLDKEERQIHNSLADESFFETFSSILSEDREAVYSDYAFKLQPPTDNKPFFYQFLRWSYLPALVETFGLQGAPFFELGSLILAINLVLLGILALVLIILPLFKLGRRTAGRAWTFFYFGSLGAGFMLLEIVLMQKLTLFLGNPVIAAAAAISGLLFFSGLGSLYSSRLRANALNLRRSTCFVSLFIAIFAISIIILQRTGSHLATPVLWASIFILVVPLGFFMGIPFPVGLRALEKKYPAQLPWAWGINGCFSVVSPAMGLAVALHAGFNAVFVLAAIAYLLAAGVNLKKH